jgi:Divergent InlB B-repeat domain
MAASAARPKRTALAAAALLVALGLHAASAKSQSGEQAEIQLVTAGPGTLTIAPAEFDPSAVCEVNAQQDNGNCVHHFEEGTTVTLTAAPKPGHSFFGWSDFKCARQSTTCTMTLAPGSRYVAARFSPVTLKISNGDNKDTGEDAFGSVTVTPKPSRACAFDDGSCEYPFGTTVTLRRSRSARGYFWIGSCIGNRAGKLDAAACTIRLQSSEWVGAGYATTGEIPPVKGSGIEIRLAGKGQGKVTGGLVNGGKTLKCQGVRCSITGLTRYDYVRLKTQVVGRSRFDRWSDGVRAPVRVVGLASTNRLWAKFDKRR